MPGAEHKITDFVDQNAIDRLQQLSREMTAVKDTYVAVAKELLKGLDCPVKTLEDLQKLMEMYNKSERAAIETTERMNRVVEEQRQIVANTTNTISRELAEQEKANKAMREAYAEHGKVKALLEQVNGTYESNLKLMQQQQQKIDNCKARLAELRKEYKDGKISQEEYDRQQLEVTKNMRLLSEEKRQLTVLIKNEEREMTTVQGSYNHLSQQLELLKKAYKEMNEEGKASELGKDMEAAIQGLDAHLKDLAADMGEFQRNVGNYAISGKAAKKEMKELVLDIADLTLAYRNLSEEEKNSAYGQGMKKHIDELTERAGALKDAIDDTSAAIKNAASDSRAFDQISAGIKLLIDGFGLATGAAQMLGLSEEDLVEVQTKLQAAIVASNAVKEIQIALQKQSALMQYINTIQTKAAAAAEWAKTAAVGKGTIATKAATVAQAAFNAVAKANPYVLLAMAVVTVVGALATFVLGSKKATKAEEEHQKALEESRKKMQEYRETIGNAVAESLAKYKKLQMEWGRLKSDHEKNEWIKNNKKSFEDLGFAVGDAYEAEKVLVKYSEKVVEALIARAKATAVAQLYMEEYKKKIAEEISNPIKIDASAIERIGEERANDPRLQDTQWGNVIREQYKEAAQAAREAEEESQRTLNTLESKVSETESAAAKLEAELAEILNLSKKVDGPKNDKSKAKSEEELAAQILKTRQNSVKAQLALEKEGTEEWLKLKQDAIELDRQAAVLASQKTYEQTKAELEKSLAQRLITQEQYNAMLVTAAQENENQIVAIDAQAQQNLKDAHRATVDYKIEKTQEEFAARQAIADQAYNDELKNLQRAHAANLEDIQQRQTEELTAAGDNALRKAEIIAKYDAKRADETTKYENQVAEATERYAQETAQRQIDAIESVLAMEDLSAEEREKLQAELKKAKTDLANAAADAEIAAIQRTQKAEEEAAKASEEAFKKRMENAQKYMQVASQALNAINGLAQAIFDGKIQRIEEEQEALNEKYEEDTERNQTAADEEQELIADLVEKKVITEEEGEARKRAAASLTAQKQKELDAKKAKQDEELEKKKQALKTKSAKWNKANSIIQAAISTATGIMQTIASCGFPAAIPMIAAVAAIGALQIAAIAAQPIPKYAKGTKDHPGGPAIVGDAGKHEVIELNGELLMTPDKPTMIDLPKGAAVYPDVDEFIEKSLTVMPVLDTSGGREIVQVNFDMKGLERKLERNTDILKSIEYGQKQFAKVLHDAAYDAEYERYKESRI